jgi:acyl-CoA synthetase (AMP-forming)/AMP-acid ligase II
MMSDCGLISDGRVAVGSIVEILRYRAAASPDRLALSFWQDGEQETDSFTYGQLDRRVRLLSANLARRFEPGARLVLSYDAGGEFVEAFFACLYAGLIAVPVALPPAGRGIDSLATVVRQIGADAVLTSRQAEGQLVHAMSDSSLSVPLLVIEGIGDDGDSSRPLPRPEARDIAFLQCTSGSTSRPRAVAVRHQNIIANSVAIKETFGHTEDSRGVIWLPHYHDMGLIGGIIQPLAVGFPVVLMPPAIFMQQPKRWLKAISKTRATTSGGPPFAYHACVSRFTDAELDLLDLSAWSVAFVGAEPISDVVLQQFATRFARCGFRSSSFLPCYGLAEATLMASGGPRGLRKRKKAADAAPQADGLNTEYVSCGCVVRDHELVIVDVERGCVGEEGVEGEIWLRGPSVAAGYWEDPAETARTFEARLADSPDCAFLRTGDLGFLSEGELHVTGRIKDLIIVRGKNLHPQDIEESACRVVNESGNLRAAAFSVIRDGSEELILVQEVPNLKDSLLQWAERIKGDIVREYGIRCHELVLVRRKSIPRTTSGKVMRSLCRHLYLSGALEPRRIVPTQ